MKIIKSDPDPGYYRLWDPDPILNVVVYRIFFERRIRIRVFFLLDPQSGIKRREGSGSGLLNSFQSIFSLL